MAEIRTMETHEIAFPFVIDNYSGPLDGEEAFGDIKTWRPGTRCESGEEYDDEEWQADGMGKMVLQVVGRFKPGKYAERTFYLRSFIDPTGKQFGKDKLRIIASSAFNRMLKGYRHKFTLPDGAATEGSPASGEAK